MKKLKKLLVVLAGVVTVVCLAVGLAGCASDVDGNTYRFSGISISVSDDNDTSDEEIAEAEEYYTAYMENAIISFADGIATMTIVDGSSATYSYTQDSSKVLVYNDDEGEEFMAFTVSGSSLIWEYSYDGATYEFTFKKA